METPRDRFEPWDPEKVYVIGHQRPDTDAIAAALGYAWFLKATGQENVTPARAGQPAAQTLFALERFGTDPPRLLAAAAPTFGHAMRPQTPVSSDAPLSEAMAVLEGGGRVVPVVDRDERPVGLVSAMALARAYAGAKGAPEALTRPCGEAAESAPSFEARERISDHRGGLVRSEADDFLVTDDEGRYAGLAPRRRIVEPPRARLILVDHNELPQAVSGAEEAEIIAVLDHHRLGNPPTVAPIPFVVEPVGSTCTLVAERCRACRDPGALNPPAGLAGVMLSGILSDTLVFHSPTTTDRDRAAAAWLAELAGVDAAAYGQELLRAAPGLAGRAAGETVDGDRKSYQMGGKRVSVAQVEVAGFGELPDCRSDLLAALEERRGREALSLIALMVTDVVTGRSRLLGRGDRALVAALPFSRTGEGEWDLGGMVSRKKQLVPALEYALNQAG
jgi:manganese-dependent inorganic pyrophosphatase